MWLSFVMLINTKLIIGLNFLASSTNWTRKRVSFAIMQLSWWVRGSSLHYTIYTQFILARSFVLQFWTLCHVARHTSCAVTTIRVQHFSGAVFTSSLHQASFYPCLDHPMVQCMLIDGGDLFLKADLHQRIRFFNCKLSVFLGTEFIWFCWLPLDSCKIRAVEMTSVTKYCLKTLAHVFFLMFTIRVNIYFKLELTK